MTKVAIVFSKYREALYLDGHYHHEGDQLSPAYCLSLLEGKTVESTEFLTVDEDWFKRRCYKYPEWLYDAVFVEEDDE